MTIKQNLKSVIGEFLSWRPIVSYFESSSLNLQETLSDKTKDLSARGSESIKNMQSAFFNFTSLEKNNPGAFLRQDQVIKAFAFLTTTLLVIYLAVYKSIGIIYPGFISVTTATLPLLVSAGLFITAYKKMNEQSAFIIMWILPAAMVLASLYNPEINYSKIILIYTLALLFVNTTRSQKSISFIYLTIAYMVMQLRYYYVHIQSRGSEFIIFEVVMIPVLSWIIFMVLARVKKEFTDYQAEIRMQKNLLEKKNSSLESLISFSEQQRNKLKRTVLLKEKLISVISHDIRVPLNSFKLLIDNYENGYMTDKMVIDGIVETKKDISKIDEMVLDLVNWSRNDTCADGRQLVSCDSLPETMSSVLCLYKLCAKTKQLEIVPELDIPAYQHLGISKREFEIIIRNLLSNAIKFSNQGNKILVSLKAENGNAPSMATLSIKDFGTGMHPSTLKRLNGTRMKSTTGTLEEVGLGIGLSIVFDVINNHSLKYNIESELNKGTEFSIQIPLVNC